MRALLQTRSNVLASWIVPLVLPVAFITLLFHGPGERVLAYRQLVDSHATALATVSETDCGDHGHVSYVFDHGNRSWTGGTYHLDRPCQQVLAGENVSIYFDPKDPTVSTTMSPEGAYEFHRSQLFAKLLMALGVVGLSIYPALRARWRKPEPGASGAP